MVAEKRPAVKENVGLGNFSYEALRFALCCALGKCLLGSELEMRAMQAQELVSVAFPPKTDVCATTFYCQQGFKWSVTSPGSSNCKAAQLQWEKIEFSVLRLAITTVSTAWCAQACDGGYSRGHLRTGGVCNRGEFQILCMVLHIILRTLHPLQAAISLSSHPTRGLSAISFSRYHRITKNWGFFQLCGLQQKVTSASFTFSHSFFLVHYHEL